MCGWLVSELCGVTKIYFCKQQKIPNTAHMTVGIQQLQIYTWGI